MDCFVTVTFRRNPEGRLVAQENDGGELPRGVAEEGERAAREVVVGNPIWEEVAIEVLLFYGLYRPGIVALAEKERRQCVDELVRERPGVSTGTRKYSIALVVAQRGLPTVGHRVSCPLPAPRSPSACGPSSRRAPAWARPVHLHLRAGMGDAADPLPGRGRSHGRGERFLPPTDALRAKVRKPRLGAGSLLASCPWPNEGSPSSPTSPATDYPYEMSPTARMRAP